MFFAAISKVFSFPKLPIPIAVEIFLDVLDPRTDMGHSELRPIEMPKTSYNLLVKY